MAIQGTSRRTDTENKEEIKADVMMSETKICAVGNQPHQRTEALQTGLSLKVHRLQFECVASERKFYYACVSVDVLIYNGDWEASVNNSVNNVAALLKEPLEQ